MKNHLILLAKNPFDTRIKTRLAKAVGQQTARSIYARLLYETLFAVLTPRLSPIKITLSMASADGAIIFREAFPELIVTQQGQGNLGDRLWHEIQSSFIGGAKRVIIIGTDLPGMNWEILDHAFEQISETKMVIGPTTDGGFYLVGMAAPGRNIFQNVPWSSEKTLESTINNLQAGGLAYELLPEMADIDYEQDWVQWRNQQVNQQNEG